MKYTTSIDIILFVMLVLLAAFFIGGHLIP